MDNQGKQVKAKNSKLIVPFIVTLVGAILLLATIFMPYATATDDHAALLNQYSDEVVVESLDMTAKDAMNISMLDYAKVYMNLGEQIFGNASYGIFYVTMVALIGGFSLLALLFSILKKPICIMIFDVLAFGVFSIQNWDYTSRGAIPSSTYDWGIAYYLFYLAIVVVLAGAVWMLVNKIRIKKQNKVIESV